jgi:hypothetical protein
MRKWAPVTFVVGHLALVVCGAAGSFPSEERSAPAAAYGASTGASNSYGFFAPGVSSMPRVVLIHVNARGERRESMMQEQANREVSLRFGTGVSMFLYSDSQAQRELASGWAAAALARDPDAQRVTVRVELYAVPTMAEYRAGKRTRWVRYYEGEFARATRELVKGGGR